MLALSCPGFSDFFLLSFSTRSRRFSFSFSAVKLNSPSCRASVFFAAKSSRRRRNILLLSFLLIVNGTENCLPFTPSRVALPPIVALIFIAGMIMRRQKKLRAEWAGQLRNEVTAAAPPTRLLTKSSGQHFSSSAVCVAAQPFAS